MLNRIRESKAAVANAKGAFFEGQPHEEPLPNAPEDLSLQLQLLYRRAYLVDNTIEVYGGPCSLFDVDPGKQDGVGAGTFSSPDLDALCQIATPARFGKGNESVLDPEVRSGLSIDLRALSGMQFSAEFTEGCEAQLSAQMAYKSWTPFELELEPQKLHIYRPGGHFKTHRDHREDRSHVGTLVVDISPESYEGGDFYLAGTKVELGRFGGVFFHLTDEHEITPVTNGTRVTVQFAIKATYDTSLPRFDDSDCDEEDCYQANVGYTYKFKEEHVFPEGLGESVAAFVDSCVDFLGEGVEHLIVPLFHDVSEFSPDALVGLDRMIYQRFRAHGMVGDPIVRAMNCTVEADGETLSIKYSVAGVRDFANTFIIDPCKFTSSYIYAHQEYIEYTGNEPQNASVSGMAVCMVVSLATLGKRKQPEVVALDDSDDEA